MLCSICWCYISINGGFIAILRSRVNGNTWIDKQYENGVGARLNVRK